MAGALPVWLATPRVRSSSTAELASVALLTEYGNTLSRSGVFIRSDEPLPVVTRVSLLFTVICGTCETIAGVGEVVRCVPPGSGSRRLGVDLHGAHRVRAAGHRALRRRSSGETTPA